MSTSDLPITETPAPTPESPEPTTDTATAAPVDASPQETAQEQNNPAEEAARPPQKRGARRKKKPAATPRQKTPAQNAPHPPVSYRPEEIILRLQKKQGVLQAYQEDARLLYLHIRQWGLGTALSLLLSDPQVKRKQRLYWDLSKWMLKEHRLKGKNNRNLIESVIYGDSLYLLRATEASLSYLETILNLARQAPLKATQSSALPTKESETLQPAENSQTSSETLSEAVSETAADGFSSETPAEAEPMQQDPSNTETSAETLSHEGQEESSIHV